MYRIKNKTLLVGKADSPLLQTARALALQSLECALDAANPKKLLHSKLLLKNSALIADGYSIDLNNVRRIYVVGGGKAGGAMAEALEEILGNRITAGAINVPHGDKHKTSIIKINEANHPVPDQAGIEGTRRMIALAEQATEEDLVVCLISGGGSSLMPLPRESITLEDKKALTEALLGSGATIDEINTLRKHVSAFKGGWLAKAAYPASVLNLILSDVVGDHLDAIASGPTVPDHTTFSDVQKVLQKYSLWAKVPASVCKVVSDGVEGIVVETPKAEDPAFRKVHTVIVGSNKISALAALEYLKAKGLNTLLLSTTLEGEAKHAGAELASVALNVATSDKPLAKPAGVVAGGETTVVVTGKGLGGRNQELTLSAALKLKDTGNCVLASLSTDGIDGPTDAAGAIADGCTLARAEQLELDAEKLLADNNSYRFFGKLGDLICTGATGTNVNDISVIVVL